jgi:hypothetical protein
MDLNEKLVNVRRSVRILAGWHGRVLDMLQKIEIELAAVPGARSRFLLWEPVHHAHVDPPDKSPLQRWGWDFLPLQSSAFTWTTDGKDRPVGKRSLSVWVQVIADDGYAVGVPGPRGPDPTTFRDPADCHSRLEIWLTSAAGVSSDITWAEIESAIARGVGDDELWSGHPMRFTTSQLPGLPARGEIHYAGWRVDMLRLGTEAEFTAGVLEPIRRRARAVLLPVEPEVPSK